MDDPNASKIREVRFKSWRDFIRHIDDFEVLWSEDKDNRILFRGHGDSRWPLLTTLERRIKHSITLQQYLEKALRYRRQVEAETEHDWRMPNNEDLVKTIAERYARQEYHDVPMEVYPYLVYLRQHGFPSPFLDWTRSPFIASYFAFCNAPPEAAEVAVFVFTETETADRDAGLPSIKVHKPSGATHRRHFLQQSWYTTASLWVPTKKDMSFVNHEKVMEKYPSDKQVHKMVLPIASRKDALRWLSMANINYYALFRTEDSLIQAIASRVFDID